MDPTQAFYWLANTIREDGDFDEAKEGIHDIVKWLSKGGFPPDNEALIALLKTLPRLLDDAR